MGLVGNLPLCTHRYAMFVSYIGTHYKGSQRLLSREQVNTEETVSEALECAIENFMHKKKSRVTSASRTDKGVHALMNCFTLPLMDFQMPTEKFKRLINANLIRKAHNILVNEVILVPAAFHPRAHAVSREYIYRIAVARNDRISSLCKDKCQPSDLVHLLPITEIYKILPVPCLDIEKATAAIDLIRGEHDFKSFTTNGGDIDSNTVRNLEISMCQTQSFEVDPNRESNFDVYSIHLKSRSFLHNQVRRLVGTILAYASFDTMDLAGIKWLIDKPRRASSVCAEPWGLYLTRINYDKSKLAGSMKTNEDKTRENLPVN